MEGNVTDALDLTGPPTDSEEARFIFLSNNGTHTLWSFSTTGAKNVLDRATGSLLFSSVMVVVGFALVTLYHAAYYGNNKSGRRKRSVGEVFGEGGEPQFRDFEGFPTDFDALYALDSNWCALRLACELSARASAALGPEERNLMKYFRSVITQPDLRSMATPQLYYGYASYLGFDAGHPEKCQSHYPKCPFSSKKMLDIYTSERTTDGMTKMPKNTKPKTTKDLLTFRGRQLNLDDQRAWQEGLTSYERRRRQARQERVQYLLRRRQAIMDRRHGGRMKEGTELRDRELDEDGNEEEEVEMEEEWEDGEGNGAHNVERRADKTEFHSIRNEGSRYTDTD